MSLLNLLSARQKPLVPPPLPATMDPTNLAHAAQLAAQVQGQRARAAQGVGATILTGPAGVTDPAATQRKTLLGG